MGDLRPRLLWLNGPHYVGKRTLARTLRDQWGIPVLDAGAIGTALEEGMPPAHAPGGPQVFKLWLWCTWRLGVEMARAYRVVTMPSALHRPELVNDMLSEFRRVDVDVLHVVIGASDAELRSRIHGHAIDDAAKRRALEHRGASASALAVVPEAVHLDSTGRTPRHLAGDLARALVQHGWLTDDLAWTGGDSR